MISKIKDTSAQMIQQYQKNDPIKTEADKAVGAQTPASATEKVDLSSRAKEIHRIKQLLDQIPDVREAKVQELKSRIDSGNYRVNADKIAEKMIDEYRLDSTD
jgi:flagellar biosynthesis anti-sigma factor FlgM